MAHTELPWTAKIYKNGPKGMRYIMWGNEGKESICISDAWPNGNIRTEANAAFIVKSVNNHEKLLDALMGLTEMYVEMVDSGDCGNWDPETDNEVIAAREAIKQAEAE